MVHDVTRAPFPVQPELLLCRFLLTHLRDTEAVLAVWAGAASPTARLLVHEVESLQSDHPTLTRYYELVAQLQAGYGQALDVGARLTEICTTTESVTVTVVVSVKPMYVAVMTALPAARMAELHLANLRTWRSDDHARRTFDAAELDRLDGVLARIVDGVEPAGPVRNVVRQVIAELAP